MSNFFKSLLLFGLGAAVGGFGSSLYFKKKYREDLDHAAQQIKKDLANERRKESGDLICESPEEKAKTAQEKPSIVNYMNMYKEGTVETDKESWNKPKASPTRIITEKELYSDDGNQYIGVTLTLYSDGILADSDMNVVKNVKEIIGDDILERFYGTNEEESMLVRNDETMMDYEIIKSSDLYTEVVKEASEQEE